METGKYWTGIADVTSDEMPSNISGAVYRVLTFAENYKAFIQKVTEVLKNSGDTLFIIEEPENLTEFLKQSWLTGDHEIYEMMPTAEKNQDDVVCGEIGYYFEEGA
jgi:glutathionylspermidine synthase